MTKTDDDILDDELDMDDDLDTNSNDRMNDLNDNLNDDMFNDNFMNDNFGMDNGGGISPMEKHKDLLKDLTNFDPYLRETVNNWLGLTWDEEEQKFVRNKFLKPVMSKQGAAWCIGLQKTYTRGNNIITDIGDEDYKQIMEDHIDAIYLNIGTRDDLGVREDGDVLRVGNELYHSAALALMGAGDGKYNKFLGTTYSYSNNTSFNPGMNGGMGQPQMINQPQPPRRTGLIQSVKNKLMGIN